MPASIYGKIRGNSQSDRADEILGLPPTPPISYDMVIYVDKYVNIVVTY